MLKKICNVLLGAVFNILMDLFWGFCLVSCSYNHAVDHIVFLIHLEVFMVLLHGCLFIRAIYKKIK